MENFKKPPCSLMHLQCMTLQFTASHFATKIITLAKFYEPQDSTMWHFIILWYAVHHPVIHKKIVYMEQTQKQQTNIELPIWNTE